MSNFQKDYDVVITDIVMPGICGMNLLKEIKKIKDSTEVIIITGYGGTKNVQQALHDGAFDFIGKPFKLEDIHNLTDKAIERKKRKLRFL